MSAAGGDGGQPGGREEYPEPGCGQFDWQHSPHVRCYGEQGEYFFGNAIEYFSEIIHPFAVVYDFVYIHFNIFIILSTICGKQNRSEYKSH